MPRHDPPPDISPTASAAAGDSDDDLVRGIAAGNQAAWGILLGRYLDRITGYAWHMLRDRAEAEDRPAPRQAARIDRNRAGLCRRGRR